MSSNVKALVLPPLVLGLICLVITAALAATYNITQPIIAKQDAEAADAARMVVLPEGDSFTLLELAEMPEGGVDAYSAGNGAGYVITTSASGYKGAVVVMAGIRTDGTLAGVVVLSSDETAGIGTKAQEPGHLAQYVEKNAGTLEEVNFISGATVTSKAVHKAVQQAYAVYGEITGTVIDTGPVREPIDDSIKAELFPDVTEFVGLNVAGEAYRAGDAGYIVVVSRDGFIDYITTALALDNDGAVIAAKVVQNNESEDYGSKLRTKRYMEGLVGLTDAEDVEMVAGATISSEAFKQSMRDAFELFPQLAGAAEGEPAAGAAEVVTTPVREPIDEAAKTELFPGVAEFVRLDVAGEAYRAGSAGYIVVVSQKGFVDDIVTALAMDESGTVTAAKVIQNNESEDYGHKLKTKKYIEALAGLTDAEGVEMVAGATISSEAFKRSMRDAFELFPQLADAQALAEGVE